MDLKLNRIDYRADGIVSELVTPGGKIIAHTLEHSYDSKPKLPPGVYKCVHGTHRLHDNVPFETFEVTGVEGHSGILFHQGNWNKDSDGCILLGDAVATSKQGTMITNSKVALHDFMSLQAGVNSFTLTVQE